jgi:hypothetical protein
VRLERINKKIAGLERGEREEVGSMKGYYTLTSVPYGHSGRARHFLVF